MPDQVDPPRTGLLNRGRAMVAIPGPSIMPDRVLAAMHRALPNIYAGELPELTDSILADLPRVVGTDGRVFIAVSNGHGCWQMALANTVSSGQRVLVLESGRFAIEWGKMATQAGIEVEILPGTDDGPVDPAAVEALLRADTDHSIAAVLVAHVDTATSVLNDIPAIRAAMTAADHPALFMVDAIASLGSDRFEMDAWGVDLTVGASQKGLMVPPGVGFVWVNDRALAVAESVDSPAAYWDWAPRLADGAHYLKYAGTPPVQHIYALRESLDLILDEGLENVWARHQVHADAVRAAVEAWGGDMALNITDPAARSNAVTTVRTGNIDATALRTLVEEGAGLTLGLGFAPREHELFRIGHMGHLNPPMILGTLATIEAGLRSLGVSLKESGVAAATEVIAPHL